MRQSNVSGEKKNRDAWFDLAHASRDLPAVHSRHGIVEHDCLHRLVLEESKARRSVHCREDLVSCALQQYLSDPESDEFVIHAKNKVGVLCHTVNPVQNKGSNRAKILLQYT